MTTITTPVTGRYLLSSLRATADTAAVTGEVATASGETVTSGSGVSRQQIIDDLLAKLAVYSEQYNELLKEGLQIDTAPAQRVLKSCVPLLQFVTDDDTNSKWNDPKASWDVPIDGNMDKNGDGVIDGDIDYSTFIWDKDDGVQSDWEFYANVTTELAGLKKNYMDVYTTLANQSVEFLDAVNGFKTRMAGYVSNDEDDIKIDITSVNEELDAIIYGWGKYGEDGKTINTNAINPLPSTDGSKVIVPSSGPVAIRGLDMAGVDYWAIQLDLEDQLIVDKTVMAGPDGEMDTEDDVTVINSIAEVPDSAQDSNQLYLVTEADGTYTLYIYPDIQPIVDARNVTEGLLNEYRQDAGTSSATSIPEDLQLAPDTRYHGDESYFYNYEKDSTDSTKNKEYFVLPTTRDMVVVPTDIIKSKDFYVPDGYTLVTSTDTKDYHEYDCFLIPTNLLTPPYENTSSTNNKSIHVTQDLVLQAEMYDMNGAGKNSEMTNIYYSTASSWDFTGHGSSTAKTYDYRYNAGTSGVTSAPGNLPKLPDSHYYGDDKIKHDYEYFDDGNTMDKHYFVVPPSKDLKVVSTDIISDRNFYVPEGYTLVTSTETSDYHEYDCFLIPTSLLDPPSTNTKDKNDATVHVTKSVVMQAEMYDMNEAGSSSEMTNIYYSDASSWDFKEHGASGDATVSTSIFNEWENSMNTMSSSVESQSQVMSEKLNQANTIYNNLTKVLSSTMEALLETDKEYFK